MAAGSYAWQPPRSGFYPLDRTNYYTRDLIFAIPNFCTDQGIPFPDNVNPRRFATYEDTDAQWWDPDIGTYLGRPVFGGAGAALTTQYVLPDLNPQIALRNEVTVCMLMRMLQASDTVGEKQPWHFRQSAAGQVQHYPYSDNKVYALPFGDGTSQYINATTLVDCQLAHMVTFTFRNGAQAFYQNESLLASGTQAYNPSYTVNGGENCVGTLHGGSVADCVIYAMWVWNRVMSPRDVAQFVRDPWRMWGTQRRVMIQSVAAAAAGGVGHRIIGDGWGGRVIAGA